MESDNSTQYFEFLRILWPRACCLDLELVCLLQRGYRKLSTMIPSHYDEIIAMYQHPNILTLDLTVKVARGGCALGESGLGEYSTVVVRPLLGGV